MDSDYRLPTDVSPVHYDLVLFTDLKNLVFRAAVEIDLKVNKDTSKIVLNASELEFLDVSVTLDENNTLVPVAQSLDKLSERASFVFPTTFLVESSVRLSIVYQGSLAGNLVGYYSAAWESEGKSSRYALSQFEPTAARRAIPCWDEPLCKATFSISMISVPETVNLSNMPMFSEELYEQADDVYGLLPKNDVRDWKISRFETSPKMSTYLLAFVNGDFKYLEGSFKSPLSGRTVPLRVYAAPHSIHQAQYALEVTAKVLPVYETVFGIEYPLPKLDTLAADDFDAGAMENWGLIIGRASAYLLDPDVDDVLQKQAIVGMQSHEIAHMWFGNITTMEWWTYLYLNEGFATLMGEMIIPDRVFPEWKLDSQFITMHNDVAFDLDSKMSAHPVEVDCPDANKIIQIFDALSYSKAASVLRMLANHVGEENFLKGVSLYLKERLYGNSVTNDLWNGIVKATGAKVLELMDSFISKPGYPVLTVTETPNRIHVRQDRFLQTGIAETAENQTIWNVPLNILTVDSDGNANTSKTLLTEREGSYVVDTSKTFKLNSGTFGYYRVLYTPERFHEIATEAAKEDSVFDDKDRLGIVQDLWAFSAAGLMDFSTVLETLELFKDRREYNLWLAIATGLSKICSIWWEHEEIMDLLNRFRRSLFKPLVCELGYDFPGQEHPDVPLLRRLAVSHAYSSKDEEVIQELRGRFARFKRDKDRIAVPNELEEVVYSAAVRYGGRDDYLTVRQIAQNSKSPTTQVAAMMAMCSAVAAELVQITFDYIFTEARDQDITYFFQGLGRNHNTRRRLVEFFKRNYDTVYEKFKDGFAIGGLVKETFDPLTTEVDLKETKDFFEDKDTSKYALTVSQILDSIQANVVILERSTPDLQAWLHRRFRN